MSGSAAVATPSPAPSATRSRLLKVLAVAAFVVLAAVAVVQAVHLLHAYERLHALRTAGIVDPNVTDLRDWMPLRVIARRYHVPEPELEDALRRAGFVVEPQAVAPDLPEALRRFGFGPPAAGSPSERLLPPDRQSLRQIAAHSGRDPAQAVAVVRAAILDYRAAHPPSRQAPPPVSPRGSPAETDVSRSAGSLGAPAAAAMPGRPSDAEAPGEPGSR